MSTLAKLAALQPDHLTSQRISRWGLKRLQEACPDGGYAEVPSAYQAGCTVMPLYIEVQRDAVRRFADGEEDLALAMLRALDVSAAHGAVQTACCEPVRAALAALKEKSRSESS